MFDDVFNNSIGVVTGTATAIQFPNFATERLRFKANPANTETIYIGTSEVNMWPLAAGDDTGWILADNFNDYWHKGGTGTVNHLHYWVQ